MDKSLLKVAGIIAFVIGILECCTIVGVIVGVPNIIGGLKLKEYSEMEDNEIKASKDTLLIWTIVLMFICLIAGVLALVFYLQLENPKINITTNSSTDKYDELEKLNKLYKDKAITKDEYESQKASILNK